MPLKANIGLSKKVGLPDYGSLGASCNVEVELDASILNQEPAEFQSRVNRIYQVCREAVEAQLSGEPVASPRRLANGQDALERTNGVNRSQASEKQLGYIRQLAGQIKGLGPRKLENLTRQMFDKTLSELNSLDASSLIDTLKEIKAGRLELPTANGAVAHD